MHALRPLLLIAAAGLGTCQEPATPPAWPGSDTWARGPLWDDGRAEVASYDAVRTTYGKERRYEAHLITVKETFDTRWWVKAESEPPARDALEVLKQNHVESWETENYPYRVMTSVFVPRKDVGRLVKLTLAHQEWCGNTFKEVAGFLDPPKLVSHSYWDQEGDQTLEIESDGGLLLLEDQLFLSLRSLPLEEGFEIAGDLLPSLVSSQVGSVAARRATIRVTGSAEIETGIGRLNTWKVEVSSQGGEARFWFATEHPNVLARYETPARRGTLTKLRRWAYWDRSQPDPAER